MRSMFRPISAIAMGFLIVTLISCSFADAQLSSAAVNGVVLDPSGAAIPGAKVTLRSVDNGGARDTLTNQSGNYVFVSVEPGNYAIEVTRKGFNTATQNTVTLYVSQTATFNFNLAVGTEVQQVTVSAAAAQLESSTAELGTVIDQKEVNNLPLNGRNFTQLLTLTPGASRVNTSQNSGGAQAVDTGTVVFPALNGQWNRSNLYLLDGVNNQQFDYSEYAVPPIVDAIEEFKVQSHDDLSQFGGVLGGVVNVVTKSGSSQFHGNVWDFLRNTAADASNAVTKTLTPLHQNVYGVTIGGPLLLPRLPLKRTFFFGAFEGLRNTSANELLYNVPTAAELAGDFSGVAAKLYNPYTNTCSSTGVCTRQAFANNNISQYLNPHMVALAKAIFPAPGPLISGQNGIDTSPKAQNSNNYSVRLDKQINDANSLWARISQIHVTSATTGGFVGDTTTATSDAQQWAASYVHTFGAKATLQIEGGHSWHYYETLQRLTNAPSDISAISGYDNTFGCGFLGPLPCQIPVIAITGYLTGGDAYGTTTDSDIYEGRAGYTYLLGRHQLQIGGAVSHNSEGNVTANDNVGYSAFQTQNLQSTANTGDALASFLIGAPSTAEKRNLHKLAGGGWINGVYVSDQWKATPKLTINLGLRYDLEYRPVLESTSSGSQITGSYDLRSGTYILTSAAKGLGSCATLLSAPCIPGGVLPAHVLIGASKGLIRNDEGNIQPRVGLAYQVAPATVLHLSYGRVYDVWSGIYQGVQNEGGLWPSLGLDLLNNLNSTTVTASAENPLNLASGQAGTLPAATPFAQSAYFVAPYVKNPYSDQWTVGIQQQFTNTLLFSLNYVGSRSRNLPCCDYYNTALTPGPGTPQSRAPFTYIAPTHYEQSNGSGSYNALQAQISRRVAKGLSYTLNYTWSKTIDTACDGLFGVEGCFVEDPYNPGRDRSVAGYDLPNIFTGSATYQLPFGTGEALQTGNKVVNAIIGGWSVNTIVSLTSGAPYTVSYSGDVANTGNDFQGVNTVGNPHLSNPTTLKWFNTAAYQAPASFTFGDTGRNTLRSDWYKDMDLSVFRSFKFERVNLELRAEAFNALNNPVYAAPGATLNSTTFGQVSSTVSTARQLQLAAKISF
jgi:hypothetical protein